MVSQGDCYMNTFLKLQKSAIQKGVAHDPRTVVAVPRARRQHHKARQHDLSGSSTRLQVTMQHLLRSTGLDVPRVIDEQGLGVRGLHQPQQLLASLPQRWQLRRRLVVRPPNGRPTSLVKECELALGCSRFQSHSCLSLNSASCSRLFVCASECQQNCGIRIMI